MATQPTLALLGSTGKTGRVVLRLLLAQNIYKLKIYIRSAEKLFTIFPDIASNPLVQLYVGHITNQAVIEQCLSGAEVIICALGDNGYWPSTVLTLSAHSIVTALKAQKQHNTEWTRPRMIYLSSSTANKRFAAARPPFVHWLIGTAFQNGYTDLKAAHEVILADPSLVSVLLVQPGALVEDEGTGHELSTESVKLATSYEDLGAAFVELATTRGYSELHEVGVSSQQGDRFLRYARVIFGRILWGLFVCYFPGVYMIRRFIE